jgi:hypothetical protein
MHNLVITLIAGKMVPCLARAIERTTILNIICRYLNLVKNQRMILEQIDNLQVVTTLKV